MQVRHTFLHWLTATVVLLPACSAQAQDANLLVQHWTRSVGADGITRTVECSERIYRRASQIWIERVIPAGVHSHEDHAKGGSGHRHIDASTAARWISREADGSIKLRLVPIEGKVLVDVAKTDYANAGFDGSWDAAWYLMDPAALKGLKRRGQNGELVRYGAVNGAARVEVIWNTRGEFPVSVDSVAGQTHRRTTVRVMPCAA